MGYGDQPISPSLLNSDLDWLLFSSQDVIVMSLLSSPNGLVGCCCTNSIAKVLDSEKVSKAFYDHSPILNQLQKHNVTNCSQPMHDHELM